MPDRHLDWRGTFNSRDLGGLPTTGGGLTRRGAVVRSDALTRLEAQGWEEAEAFGIRTVIDLRNESEIGPDASPRPASIETVNIPLDVSEDREFWDVWENGPQFATPLYYRPHLERFPERSAAVIRAIAQAPPGGVVFHCQGGRDRAGETAMLVLALCCVDPVAIGADYALSDERLPPMYAAEGRADIAPEVAAYLRDQGTTAPELIERLLAGFDVEAALLAAGLETGDIAALRRRLLD